MNKKISQFELTKVLQEHDLITLVQDKENRNIAGGDFITSLSNNFATNTRVDGLEDDLNTLDTKVDDNYTDLSNKIIEGDTSVTTNLNSTITSYYDVLNGKIITLEVKHDGDFARVNNTVQEWIDDIDNRSTVQQLEDALNRLTVAENTITALADIIANGGGSGDGTVGFHTQPTSTITSLQGYFKGTNADPLVVTDSLNQALSKLENQVDAVTNSSGSLPVIKTGESTVPTDKNIYTAGKVKEDYIYKYGDTVPGKIKYITGLQGGNEFRSGWDGIGASLYPSNSKWNLELDNLFVRGNMTVNELTVNEIKAVGGDILVSVADMECIKVVELADGYQCFFDTEDGTKYNEFLVNDQVICQKFDGKNVKRYWRAVSAVGRDYITLSKEICEAGSAEPAEGDQMLLLGHRFEGDADYNKQMEDRRNAIFISSKGANSPRIAFYADIDDFTLEGKDRTVIGKDSKFVGTITVVGADGSTGGVVFYRGAWSAEKTYYYYDCVTHNGSTWIATQENENKEPYEGSPYWTIYIAKGENGISGDDVAKWVEITGNRMFLYDSPDFSGTPTPVNLGLNANVYGIEHPSYIWTNQNHEPVEYQQKLVVSPEMVTDRTEVFRCTVTDEDTGATYYDEVQVAKLSNGAEGLDAYYIDLTNYSASVPFSANGTILIDPTTIYTDVFAYRGINQVPILDMTASFTQGSGTVTISENRVTLASLLSTSARITLKITVDEGVVVTKDWYINQSKDGENGFNGEDAVRTYLTGDQYFHYTEYSDIPNPPEIELRMDTNMIDAVSYQWYWALAGTGEWNLLQGESNPKLIVVYNGVYFQTGSNEISFRCVVTNSSGNSFEDIITINNVRDGDSAYRGSLENELMTVPSNYEGVVSDWSNAVTPATLRRGGKRFENSEYTLRATLVSGSGTLTINQDTKRISVNTSSVPNRYLVVIWNVDFIYDGTVVDTVSLRLAKNATGKEGDVGNASVQIYTNTNYTPSRPTFTQMISASGGTSGGYAWYPDPTNSTTTLTWTSTGYYNPNTASMDPLPDGSGYRWTKPVVFSPLNGADGSDGRGITSVTMQYYKSTSQTYLSGGSWNNSAPSAQAGYWIWTRLYILYDDGSSAYTNAVCTTGATGSDGDYGPGLSYRGEYDSSKSYMWSTNTAGNVRDIVKYNKSFYAVNRSQKNRGAFSGRTPSSYAGEDGAGPTVYWVKFNSFENVATDLLFADKATIAGWDFYNDRIQSGAGTMRLDGNTSAGVLQNIHLAIGSSTAAENPSSAPFRVDINGNCYTQKLQATGGKIGGFTITGSMLVGDNGSYQMSLSPTTMVFGTASTSGTYAAIGQRAVSGSTGVNGPFMLINTIGSRNDGGRGNGYGCATFAVGSAQYSSNDAAQKWITCNHYSNYGWGSEFSVSSRYFGDANQMERTCINVANLPTHQALKNSGLANDATFDVRLTSTGYLYLA